MGPAWLPFSLATKAPMPVGIALSFSMKLGLSCLFSSHLLGCDFRFRKQKNSRPLIRANAAMPPKTPPMMPPMFPFPFKVKGLSSPGDP